MSDSCSLKIQKLHQLSCAQSESDALTGAFYTYLQRQIESLLTVSLIVQSFLKPQSASLLLFVTDNVELLLLISCHNTEGQLSIFSDISILSRKFQDLGIGKNIISEKL